MFKALRFELGTMLSSGSLFCVHVLFDIRGSQEIQNQCRIQVMVSDAGVYHGDMKQRTSESMPFSRFLRAVQMTDGRMPQHLYLAQACIP